MQTDEALADVASCLQRGEVAGAYQLLRAKMKAGRAEAAAMLADWRMSGQVIRRDLAEARSLYGRALKLGFQDAELPYIALLANGAGGMHRRWPEALRLLRQRARRDQGARQQVAALDAMRLDSKGDPLTKPVRERLSEQPEIERLPSFLTADECSALIGAATPLLQPAVVVHPATGALVRDPIRTSSSAAFPFVDESPFIHALNRRIAAATDTSYDQGEPLQVLRYNPGEEYKLHLDALPPGSGVQRTLTLLVYLNDDFEGGETFFPAPNLRIRGRRGDAVLFRNVDREMRPDPAARHAGLPVRSGSKLLLSKWIRSAPLDLAGPPGRPF